MQLQAKARLHEAQQLEAKPQGSVEDAKAAVEKAFSSSGLQVKVEVDSYGDLMCSCDVKFGENRVVTFDIVLDKTGKGSKAIKINFSAQPELTFTEDFNDVVYGIDQKEIADVAKIISNAEEFAQQVDKEVEAYTAWWMKFGLAMRKLSQLSEDNK